MAEKTPGRQINSEVYEALGEYGIAMMGAVTDAAKSYPSPIITGNEVKDSLNKMVSSYQTAIQTQKAGIGMLDASFELAITGTELATGGSAILATSAVRWVKNVALDELKNKADENSKRLLAANIDRFKNDKGLDYASLQKKEPQEIKEVLGSLQLLSEIQTTLAGDSQAQGIVEAAVIDTLINTDKAELERLAQHGADIEATKSGLASIGKQLSDYTEKTDLSLKNINNKIDNTQKALDAANDALSSLKNTTKNNTQQIQAVSEMLFSKASPSEKLMMLQSGHLKDSLDENQRKELITVITGQQKKEQLLSDINNVVSTFNSIGQIAKNLGVGGDLIPAISTASAVAGVVSNIVSQNYLGAVVGISGLFGKSPADPASERHKQLLDFLEKRFAEIDKKLGRIIEGQKKIMETLGKISEQMALYDRILHDRLDRVEFKLDTIESMTRAILFHYLANCGIVKSDIRQATGKNSDHELIIANFEDAKVVSKAAKFDDINDCIMYLRGLFYNAFDPQNLGLESLALRHSNKINLGPYYKKGDQEEYFEKTKIQAYYQKQYKPTFELVLNSPHAIDSRIKNYPFLLSLLVLPVNSVNDLEKKLVGSSKFSQSACSKNSILGEPLIQILCTAGDDISATRLKLPEHASQDIDDNANLVAFKVLETPLMQDPLLYLADWSLFFAPIYDHFDLENEKILTTLDEFVEQRNLPKGPKILTGAMQVLTIGIAQLNLLYGDLTSKLIFELLWKKDTSADCKPSATQSCEERFYTVSELSTTDTSTDENLNRITMRKKAAYDLLASNNTYLLRNVLMHALAHTSKVNNEGAFLAYQTAIDHMKSASVQPDSLLISLFGQGMQFTSSCSDVSSKDCIKSIEANFLGLKTPLPSAEEFRERRLIYPPLMKDFLAMQNRLSSRLAEYNTFNWSAINEKNSEGVRELLVKTLLKTNKN